MPKRKENPLSAARGKQQTAENIWFRRSGAGFSLFLEYYSGQPKGTVSDVHVTSSESASDKKATSPVFQQGRGLSRASKRRKKKKNMPLTSENGTTPRTAQDDTETSPLLIVSLQHAPHLTPFVEAMSKPLPLTCRFRLSTVGTADVRERLATFQDILSPVSFDANIYQASSLSKAAVRSASPALTRFLIEHSQDGTLARQELGSMLPVLALARQGYLRPSDKVLDLCASPGSKMMQALEIVGESGRIVANDILESRLEALKEAVERSGMPKILTSRITYHCQDASQLAIPSKLWADVVLCDVPCSGDGTCRKDKNILPMWKPNCGNELHATQVNILCRGLQLVRDGGVVCYSTCSLNPVEDEAVVAEALRRTDDVELVEWPNIPGLTRREGVTEWIVADYTGDEDGEEGEAHLCWHEAFQDAVDANMGKPRKSLWPCEDNAGLHLERCARLFPQDHDSGGFFLALIRKKRQ